MLGVAAQQQFLPVAFPGADAAHVADAQRVDVARERARCILDVLLRRAVHHGLFLWLELVEVARPEVDAVPSELDHGHLERHTRPEAGVEEELAQRLPRQHLTASLVLHACSEFEDIVQFLPVEIRRRDEIALAHGSCFRKSSTDPR